MASWASSSTLSCNIFIGSWEPEFGSAQTGVSNALSFCVRGPTESEPVLHFDRDKANMFGVVRLFGLWAVLHNYADDGVDFGTTTSTVI